ncbi:MAG: hypothetical protein ISR00_02335 [Flavobacteriales bacterium]|nr:hypothetical protein [Flavobacteriales bacterium]MBL6872771.1 hypothetical protein [Flavobacteriales bacterium]
MKKLLFMLLIGTQGLFAQDYVNQVLVLNEGKFGQNEFPVTLGSYNPVTQNYEVVDTIEGARFASDMVIDGNNIFIVADTLLLKYDLNTFEVLSTQTVVGGRNIAIVDDKLFITRGEYGVDFSSYLQVYSKSDLEFISELDTVSGPKWSTQNMVAHDGKLFIAINNGFNWGEEKSLIGVVEISTMSYLEEIDLGSEGTNPDNMVLNGDYIYTVNNKNWSGASFSKVDLSTMTATTINVSDVSTACGTSCLRGDRINFQLSQDSILYEWNPITFDDSGVNLGINENFYELAHDDINNYLYASSTDFTTFGKVGIYDADNTLVSEFDCGVSPGTIVFDIRNTTSIPEFSAEENTDNSVYDMSGRKLGSIEKQPKGVYLQSGKKVFKR